MIHKLESGIPIPNKFRGGRWKEMLAVMLPGESFMVDNERDRSLAIRCAVQLKVHVTTRKVSGVGFRIWKVPSDFRETVRELYGREG